MKQFSSWQKVNCQKCDCTFQLTRSEPIILPDDAELLCNECISFQKGFEEAQKLFKQDLSLDALRTKYLNGTIHVSELEALINGLLDKESSAAVAKLQRESEFFLKNRADAVDGHYCIARITDQGYAEYWDNHQQKWCSAGTVFNLGKQP